MVKEPGEEEGNPGKDMTKVGRRRGDRGSPEIQRVITEAGNESVLVPKQGDGL